MLTNTRILEKSESGLENYQSFLFTFRNLVFAVQVDLPLISVLMKRPYLNKFFFHGCSIMLSLSFTYCFYILLSEFYPDATYCLFRYGVTGFPTLKFFPKSNKAGEDYDGGRDLDDFVTVINEKCGTSRDAKGQLTDKVSFTIIHTSLQNSFFFSFNIFFFLRNFS